MGHIRALCSNVRALSGLIRTQTKEAVMATLAHWYFVIENCPGPFRVMMGLGHMLEEHRNRLGFDLTLKPMEAGIEFLGHNREFKIHFEVALIGATTKWGHGIEESRNVGFLGRFQILSGLQGERGGFQYLTPEACADLNEWQWEVVFNPIGRRMGFVTKMSAKMGEDEILRNYTF